MKFVINMIDYRGDNFDWVGDFFLIDWYLWFKWNVVYKYVN